METPIYTTEPLDPNNNLDSSINKKIFRIMFKIKKYYIIYVQNRRSMDFDMPKTIAKNTLTYEIFNKKNWE